jgi:hypothetical protein
MKKKAKKNKLSATKWQVVGDSVRRYILGNYQRDVIPSYIKNSIEKLPDKRWVSYFMQTLVVKHNHLTVSRVRASEKQRKTIPLLMDLEGKLMTERVPADPHPPDLFNTIDVSPDPRPAHAAAPQAPGPDQAPVEPAPAQPPVEAPARVVHVLRFSGVSRAGLDLNPNTSAQVRSRQSHLFARKLAEEVNITEQGY